jgi:hypothetical protein
VSSTHGARECATEQPFTLAICGGCEPGAAEQVVEGLRPSIRRCPHGVLVSASCLLGGLSCRARTSGVFAVLQPCSTDRVSTSAAVLLGPISRDDITAVRGWLEAGAWEERSLPEHLRARRRLVQQAGAN